MKDIIMYSLWFLVVTLLSMSRDRTARQIYTRYIITFIGYTIGLIIAGFIR